MFLEKMIAVKKKEIYARKILFPWRELEKKIRGSPAPQNFLEGMEKISSPALIAEIKQASPSGGVIREKADILKIAKDYQEGGAWAISVLTEPEFFQGTLAHLREVKEKVSLPVLQKDFIVDPYQIYEGRAAGADAILLIAAILERDQVENFGKLIRSLGMFPLVEVHDEDDLKKVSGLNFPLIGINNRNLNTLTVDLETTFRLRKMIPAGAKVISESGIRTREDVKRLREAGVHGILVGEILMRSPDPKAKIKELLDI